MKVGDVIYMRSFEHHFDHGDLRGSVGYKACEERPKKGEPTPVFVAILLGVDELENPKIDPVQALREMGWEPPDELTKGRDLPAAGGES